MRPRGPEPRQSPSPRPIDSWTIERPRSVWFWSAIWPKLARIGRTSRGKRITALVFAAVGLMIALGIYGISVWFLRVAYRVEVIGPLLCQRLLDMLLLVVLSVLALSNVVSALSSFFMAKDLDMLMTAPIPPRSLFMARFSEQIIHSSWMVMAFGIPVLLAFAKVVGTPWTYVAMFLSLPPLLIVPAAFATTLTIMLVSALPAARARDIIVALMFVGFVVLYLLLRLVEPERFLNPEGFASMVSFVASFSAPSGSALPSHWATEVIAASFRDDAGAGRPYLMLAALWTAAMSAQVIAGFVFRRVYVSAYTRSQQGRKVAKLSRLWAALRGKPLPKDGDIRSPGRRGADRDLTRTIGALAPRGAMREFLVKDLKLLARDASQWSQLVLLALIFVYLYNFRHFRKLGETGLVGPLGLFILGLGLSAFVTAAVRVRFAYASDLDRRAHDVAFTHRTDSTAAHRTRQVDVDTCHRFSSWRRSCRSRRLGFWASHPR
jgi:ABC-2 type transport system permease protein